MPLPVEEPEPPPPPEPPFAVNLVGVDTLVHLPGVGPVLAERIVASRQAEGPFRSPGDLRRVKGIGPKLSGRLGPLLLYHTAAAETAGTASSPGATGR
jgi:competence protein ComEA